MYSSRRDLLQIASSAGLLGVAGCETILKPDPSDSPANKQTGDSLLVQPAMFVISNRGETTVSVDGSTGTVRFEDESPGPVFQKTLDALQQSGGRVFVRRGRYDIARQLDINGQFTEIISDYAHLRFQNHDHYTDEELEQVDLNVAKANVRIRGVIVDGNKENRSTPTRTLNVSSAQHVSIRDSIVRGGRSRGDGFRGYGIAPYHSSHLVVDNCLILDNDRHGIHPGSSETSYQDVRITNNTFLNNGSDPTGAAIDIRDHTRSALISNNYFEGNGTGVRLKGADLGWMRISNNVFVDNYHDSREHSAQVQIWTEGADDISIRDNSFTLPTSGTEERDKTHVLLSPNGPVSNTRIRDNRFAGGSFGVISADNPEWVTVEGNHFSDIQTASLNIVSAERGVIRRNTLYHSEKRPGIHFGDVNKGIVADNILENATLEVPEAMDKSGNKYW